MTARYRYFPRWRCVSEDGTLSTEYGPTVRTLQRQTAGYRQWAYNCARARRPQVRDDRHQIDKFMASPMGRQCSPREQQVYRLYWREGWGCKRIAKELGVGCSKTIRTYVRRIRAKQAEQSLGA